MTDRDAPIYLDTDGRTVVVNAPIEAVLALATLDSHYEPHLAADAEGLLLCQCGCRECTSLGLCVCLDCGCESQEQHRAPTGPVEWITVGPIPLRGGPFATDPAGFEFEPREPTKDNLAKYAHRPGMLGESDD